MGRCAYASFLAKQDILVHFMALDILHVVVPISRAPAPHANAEKKHVSASLRYGVTHDKAYFRRNNVRRTVLDQVGRRMLVDDLLKFNTPDIFLKAVVCLQCASGLREVNQTTKPQGLYLARIVSRKRSTLSLGQSR